MNANTGKRWTPEEEMDLLVLYKYMNVQQLSEIFKKTPLAISFKIVKLGLELNIKNVVGFNPKWLKQNNFDDYSNFSEVYKNGNLQYVLIE
jgi:hypothetical protein